MTALPAGVSPRSVKCRYCQAAPGQSCMTLSMRPRSSHAVRRSDALAVAAHSDPVLDEVWSDTGPCGICGTPGLGARHRVVDAMADRMRAGESAGEVAEDYGVPVAAALAVEAWSRRWPGATG
jgi:hypothetical protein